MSHLEKEVSSLKEEFLDLKSKIDILVKKYSNLEVKYEKSLSRKRKESFKCRICDQECENLIELKNHKKEHESLLPKFKCDECDKIFLKEKQLKEHISQKHKTYPCKECEKVFDYEVNLENHIKAVHEDLKIFCHYFNNNKECPYEEECIYIHKDSEDCRFGSKCERQMCMFKHEETDDDDDEIKEQEEISGDDLKPIVEKVQKALEKFDILLMKNELKCNVCDFEAKNKNGLNMHIRSKHTRQ